MIVNNVLTLSMDELSGKEWQRLFQRMTFIAKGEIYEPWEVDPRHRRVKLPRGAWSLLPDRVEYTDLRTFPEMPELEFLAKLDTTTPDGRSFEGQLAAVKSILLQEQGLVIRPPGTGKTNIVCAAMAAVGTKSLVLVHTEDILQQWIERIMSVMPDCDLGLIKGKEFHIGHITVSTVQTFRNRLDTKPSLAREFGMVTLDEAHHASAATFNLVMNEMHARYRIGVTATKKRADDKHPLMELTIGPVIYEQKFKSKVPVKVYPIKRHKFDYRMRGTWDYRNMLNALIADEARNRVIAEAADKKINQGHSVLVLSREIQHLNNIAALMENPPELLTGQRSKKDRNEILTRFRAGEVKCLLATQLADEALDVPILSCVILTFPGKHDGRIIQQVGRALREHPGKDRAYIIDIVDDKCFVLRRQWMERKSAYRKMGIPVKKRRLFHGQKD